MAHNLVRLCLVAVVAWCLHVGLGWARARLGAEGMAGSLMPALLFGLLALCAVMIAVPFVPGVEIGLALMVLEGPAIAPWIYLATLCALVLAFLAGAVLPCARLHAMRADLGLTRACRRLARPEPLGPDARLALPGAAVPAWLRPIVRFRCLALALLVNLPGNAVFGGGGGSCFWPGTAGCSRPWRPSSRWRWPWRRCRFCTGPSGSARRSGPDDQCRRQHRLDRGSPPRCRQAA